MRSLLLLVFLLVTLSMSAQTSVGIGLYPTGTEAGVGLRLNKDRRVSLDVRATKATFSNAPSTSQFITEASFLYRVVLLEKVRFHIGLGPRAEWNTNAGASSKFGGVMPVGVEAFPFPFQNAGLIFEVAPYYVSDASNRWNGGLRTVAGFVFYFPHTKKAIGAPN